jgi:hypothetical protein
VEPTREEIAAFRERREGRARTGVVTVRDFDRGIVETLGAKIFPTPDIPTTKEGSKRQNYFIPPERIPSISPPPGLPGVPITFSNPEDVFEKWKIPVLIVSREDFSPAMERWQSQGGMQYRAPSVDAVPVQIEGREGFDRFEQLPQAVPFDISYTLRVQARHHGVQGQKNQANALLLHVMKTYPPYGGMFVRDSSGDYRSYEVFSDGASQMDEAFDVAERMASFSVSLRVEGELDLSDPIVYRSVRERLTRFNPR